jgi:hypothetical protein
MMYRKRSFREKLADDKDLPRVEPLSGKMRERWGPGTMVLPAPSEVDALMGQVRRGKLVTINRLRETLARRHGTTTACPIVTGIHAWIAARAAGEDQDAGKTRVTPFWRTLKEGGELNGKYPGGLVGQGRLLRAEGHRVVKRGKRWFVEDYERAIVRLT